MSSQPKDVSSTSGAKPGQNGNQSGFQTDSAIVNNRNGKDRTLKRWELEPRDATNPILNGRPQSSRSQSGSWDQFAENKRLFGLESDYDERLYTTPIDRNHPQYQQRMAEADRKVREIRSSKAMTTHVAEERVMDNTPSEDSGGEDNAGDEENKYSGVRRPDFAPLSTGGAGKYIPPARRAPTGQSSSRGVPVDPSILAFSIQGQGKKICQVKAEDGTNGKVSAVEGKGHFSK